MILQNISSNKVCLKSELVKNETKQNRFCVTLYNLKKYFNNIPTQNIFEISYKLKNVD